MKHKHYLTTALRTSTQKKMTQRTLLFLIKKFQLETMIRYNYKSLLLLIIGLIFINNQLFSQGVNITEITAPVDADKWSICDDVGGLFTIKTVGFGNPSTGVTMSITLQPGMEYVQDGPNPLPANMGSANAPSFTLPNYDQGDEIIYTFRIKTNCITLNYLLGPPSKEANLVFQINSS